MFFIKTKEYTITVVYIHFEPYDIDPYQLFYVY